jgi:hypothetical protein
MGSFFYYGEFCGLVDKYRLDFSIIISYTTRLLILSLFPKLITFIVKLTAES